MGKANPLHCRKAKTKPISATIFFLTNLTFLGGKQNFVHACFSWNWDCILKCRKKEKEYPKLASFSYPSKQDNDKAQSCLFFLSLSFLRQVRNHDTWLSFLTKFTKKTTRMSTNTMITAHEVFLKQNKHCTAWCQINYQSWPRALQLQKKHWKQHELSLYYLSHGTENTSTKF